LSVACKIKDAFEYTRKCPSPLSHLGESENHRLITQTIFTLIYPLLISVPRCKHKSGTVEEGLLNSRHILFRLEVIGRMQVFSVSEIYS